MLHSKEVLHQMKTTIIGIAGGSGSGKSTFTNRLKNFFGENITVIYHDNYYRANDALSMEERRKIRSSASASTNIFMSK